MLAYRSLLLKRGASGSYQEEHKEKAKINSVAFEKAKQQVAHASLYGSFMEELIAQILSQYIRSNKNKMTRGTVNVEWTITKITHLKELRKIAENAHDNISQGNLIRANLITEIQTNFLNERLPALRREYKEKNNWDANAGRLEDTYIPAILKTIELVYKIFDLFQIKNKTKADYFLPPSCKNVHEAFQLFCLAEAMAKEVSFELLGDFSHETLANAEETLKKIEASCEDFIVSNMTNNQGDQSGTDINPARIDFVYKAFITKFHDDEMTFYEKVGRNPVTVTKDILSGTLATGCNAAAMISDASAKVSNYLVDLYIGKTRGDNVESDSEDDDSINQIHRWQSKQHSSQVKNPLLTMSPRGRPKNLSQDIDRIDPAESPSSNFNNANSI